LTSGTLGAARGMRRQVELLRAAAGDDGCDDEEGREAEDGELGAEAAIAPPVRSGEQIEVDLVENVPNASKKEN
tara:strand:+ start:306 stop:527 length:222 start_codon:yes stop_codon:yes gene_type:complete